MSAARIAAKKPATGHPIVFETPETSPWARIRALEARIVDVEKRHAEAIARLSLSVELLLHAPETGTESIEGQVTKAHMRVNELVEKDWDRVFAEWEHERGADKGFKPEEADAAAGGAA